MTDDLDIKALIDSYVKEQLAELTAATLAATQPPAQPSPVQQRPVSKSKSKPAAGPIDWAAVKNNARTISGYDPSSFIWGKTVPALLDDIRLHIRNMEDAFTNGDRHTHDEHARDIRAIIDEWRKRLVYSEAMKRK